MIEMFLQNAPARIAEMRHAQATDDTAAIAWSAHSLKGSSGVFGASRMVALCETLQEQANSHPDADFLTAIEQLAREYALVRAELLKMR